MENKNITEIVARVVSEMTAPKGSSASLTTVSRSADAGKGTDVTLKMAVKLIERIEAEAKRMGVNAVIAVANKGARCV